MADLSRADELRQRLETFGDPRVPSWPDYVQALALTPADAPQLLLMARQWLETQATENEDAVYAPVHAWRAAAQLRSVELVPVLLELAGPLDEVEDDWYLEEFPEAFLLVGPAALEPLVAYLSQAEHREYPRICAVHAIADVAAGHPETRDQAVAALGRQLDQFQEQSKVLNGFLVSHLLDLKATETAEVIERAFAANRVELDIVGNWNTVRAQLGVAGLGLVPTELANAPIGSVAPPLLRTSPASAPSRVDNQRRRRAERKRERRNRRQGRR